MQFASPKDNFTQYYPYFDWLRIILAITVALSHDKVIIWPNAGNLSVQVFFALSGWLIGGILLKTPKTELPRFFFNRVTRIWVPYVLAIGLLISASLLRDPVTPKWLEFVFYKVTFVYNWFGPPQLAQYKNAMPLAGSTNHFWSICAEEQFYLLAPLLIVLLPEKIGKSIFLWLIISISAVSAAIYGAIALGVTAAVLQYTVGDWQLRKPVVLLLALGFVITAALLGTEALPYNYVAPFFSVVVVLLLARMGAKSTIGQFFGGISYPFYLNHWIGVFVAHELLEPFGLREAPISKFTSLLLNLLIAAVLYFFVDRLIRKYRNGWYNGARGWYSVAAAYSLMAIGLVGGMLIYY